MIHFGGDNWRFQCRAAAIIFHNGKLLLHRLATDNYWALPGGRVNLNEFSQATLIRELFEEIGAQIFAQNLAFVSEGNFNLDSKTFHEIGFYYVCEFAPNQPQFFKDEFDGMECDKILKYKWFDISHLSQLDIRPKFIKNINDFDLGQINHLKLLD